MRHSPVARLFLLALGLVVVSTAIGLYELWPEDRSLPPPPGANPLRTERAEVSAIRQERCAVPGARECLRVTAKLETGPDEGTESSFSVVDRARQVGLEVGDEVRLLRSPVPSRRSGESSPIATRSPTSSGGCRCSGSPSHSPRS